MQMPHPILFECRWPTKPGRPNRRKTLPKLLGPTMCLTDLFWIQIFSWSGFLCSWARQQLSVSALWSPLLSTKVIIVHSFELTTTSLTWVFWCIWIIWLSSATKIFFNLNIFVTPLKTLQMTANYHGIIVNQPWFSIISNAAA